MGTIGKPVIHGGGEIGRQRDWVRFAGANQLEVDAGIVPIGEVLAVWRDCRAAHAIL